MKISLGNPVWARLPLKPGSISIRAPTYYFLDNERADATGGELVSLALADIAIFYAERSLPELPPISFVRTSIRCSTAGKQQWLMQPLTAELCAFLNESRRRRRLTIPRVIATGPKRTRLAHNRSNNDLVRGSLATPATSLGPACGPLPPATQSATGEARRISY